MHFRRIAQVSLAVLIAAAVLPASAAPINGGFETGNFAGWATSGEVDVVGTVGTPAIAPPEGAFQAAASTNGAVFPFPPASATTPAATLESFFGLAAGSLNAIRSPNTGGNVVAGSGFYQDVLVAAGDILSFDWNFLTRETTSLADGNDFSFVVIGGTATRLIAANDSVNGPLTGPTVSLGSGSFRTSGYRTYTTTFANAGIVRIGVGAVNVSDDLFNSAIMADRFAIVSTGVPEPASWAMMMLGFGGMGYAMRRRSRIGRTRIRFA